jgi:colanic acid/amylovoran biosynthesis glycosyltransferase
MIKRGRIVLVVQSFPQISETFIVNKFRGLRERGLDVHVVCTKSEPENWAKFPSLEQSDELKSRVHVSWPHRPLWLAALLLPIVLLRSLFIRPRATTKYLKRGYQIFGLNIFRHFYLDSELVLLNPDVVHFEFGAIATGRMYVGKLLKCKLAVSFRGYDLNFVALEQQDIYSDVWKKADVIHLLGDALWQRAKQRGCHADISKALIPPAVDSTFFQCVRRISSEVGTRFRPFRILSVGRLEWKKGYEYALEAVRLLVERGIDCEYRIVGHGSCVEEVNFACHQFGLVEKVRFLGGCSQTDVRDQMVWADALLHPAISEGFCNAVLEAQSMQLPVVCTDAGGLPENVANGSTGFVVPRRSALEMANQLEVLARDPELRRRMGQAGRARATERFGTEGQIAQFVAMYQKLLPSANGLSEAVNNLSAIEQAQ